PQRGAAARIDPVDPHRGPAPADFRHRRTSRPPALPDPDITSALRRHRRRTMQYNDSNTTHRQQPHLVVFRDQSAGLRFLTRSTRPSEHTTTWEDGNIYPVVEVDLSSAAHFARKAGKAGRTRRELAGTSA